MKILRLVSSLLVIGMINSLAWAADDPASTGLDSDVDAAKIKAYTSAQDPDSQTGGLPAVEARVAALEAALDAAGSTIAQLQADLATATAQITQLQNDLSAEVLARQAADNEVSAAYMASDADLQMQIDVLNAFDVGALDSRVSNVEETLTCVSYDVVSRDLIFVGCNVHVRDGSGLTQSTSGLGNLIVGYNLDAGGVMSRFGSHNLILGDNQAYTSSGQLLTQSVGSTRDMSVTVGGNLSESVASNRTTSVGSDSSLTIGRDLNTNVGGMLNSSVDQDVHSNVGGNLAEVVAKDLTIQSGMNMRLEGADQMLLKSGAALTNMKKNGDIVIEGKSVTVKASGTITLKGQKIVQN